MQCIIMEKHSDFRFGFFGNGIEDVLIVFFSNKRWYEFTFGYLFHNCDVYGTEEVLSDFLHWCT